MAPSSWKKIGRQSELTGHGPIAASADGHDVVLLQTPSGLRAFEGRCPHQGALLGEGELDGDTLVCRNHRWRFDAATGQRTGGPQCLRACPVEAKNGEIHVDIARLLDNGASPTTGPLRDASE